VGHRAWEDFLAERLPSRALSGGSTSR
jgi:hypothetical protein